jgi:hypothetical protein
MTATSIGEGSGARAPAKRSTPIAPTGARSVVRARRRAAWSAACRRVAGHEEREARIAVRGDRVDLAGREARGRQHRPGAEPADRERQHERLDRVLADDERAVAWAKTQRGERLRGAVDRGREARVAHDPVPVAHRGTVGVARGGFGDQIGDARTKHGID